MQLEDYKNSNISPSPPSTTKRFSIIWILVILVLVFLFYLVMKEVLKL